MHACTHLHTYTLPVPCIHTHFQFLAHRPAYIHTFEIYFGAGGARKPERQRAHGRKACGRSPRPIPRPWMSRLRRSGFASKKWRSSWDRKEQLVPGMRNGSEPPMIPRWGCCTAFSAEERPPPGQHAEKTFYRHIGDEPSDQSAQLLIVIRTINAKMLIVILKMLRAAATRTFRLILFPTGSVVSAARRVSEIAVNICWNLATIYIYIYCFAIWQAS